MSFTDNWSETELNFRTSGMFSPDVDTYEDIALNSFDVTALDYDAPGLEGWGNRLMGITNFFNPVAWGGTYVAQLERQGMRKAAVNEEIGVGDFFVAAGKTAWEVGLEGFLMGGLETIERAATGVGIGLFSVIDSLGDLRDGGEISSVFSDGRTFADAFDLSKTKNLEFGELMVLNVLAIAGLVVGRQGVAEVLGYLPFTDPIEWLKSDFDPFNPDDVALFDKAGQLNAVTTVANFAGWILLDPLTYMTGGVSAVFKIPLMASYKYSYGFKAGVKTKLFAKEEEQLTKIMNGSTDSIDSQVLSYTKAMAENTALRNEMLLRGFGARGQDAKTLAFMLGRASNEQEVATILLAVNHKNKAARLKMKEFFDGDPNTMLAFDNITTGGTGNKQYARDPDIIKRTPLVDDTLPANKDYIRHTRKQADEVEGLMDDFMAAYDSLVYQTVEGGAKSTEIFGNPIMKRAFKSTGLYAQTTGLKYLYTAAKIKTARFRADVITGDEGRLGVMFRDNELGRTFVKWYRKVQLTSARGAIDFNDTGNALSDKFYSFINEADNALAGGLRSNVVDFKTGRTQFDDLIEEYQRATTTQELKQIFDQIHIITIRNLAEKHGVSSRILNDAKEWEKFIETFYGGLRTGQDEITTKQLKNGEWVEYAGAKRMEKEALDLTPENANWYQTINLEELDKYFSRYVRKGLYPSKMRSGAELGEHVLRQFNSLWSAGVLLRPARFLRERFANGLGIMMSGLAIELWLNKQNQKSIQNLFSNLYGDASAWVTGAARKTRNDMYDVAGNGDVKIRGKLSKNIAVHGETLTRINKDIDEAESVLASLEKTTLDSEVAQITKQDRIDAAYEKQINEVETRYHGTSDDFNVENISDDRLLPTSATADQSLDYANTFGVPVQQPIVRQDFDATVGEYNKRLEDLNKRIDNLNNVKQELSINNANQLDDSIDFIKDDIKQLINDYKELKNQRVISSTTGMTISINGRKASSLLGSKEYANNILKQLKPNEIIYAKNVNGEWVEYSRKEFANLDKKVLDKLEIKIVNKNEFNEQLFNKAKLIDQPEPQVVLPYGQEVLNTLKSTESVALINKNGEVVFVSAKELQNKSPKYFENYQVATYTKTKFNNFVENNGREVALTKADIVPAVKPDVPEELVPFVPKGTPARKPRDVRFAEQIKNNMADDDIILIRTKTEKGAKEQYRTISKEKLTKLSNNTIENSDVRLVKKETFEKGIKSNVLTDIKLPKQTPKLQYGEQILKGIRGDRQIWVRVGRNKNFQKVSREDFAKYSKEDLKNVEVKTTSKPLEKDVIQSSKNYEPVVALTKEDFDKKLDILNKELEGMQGLLKNVQEAKETIETFGSSFRNIDSSIDSVQQAKQQLDADFNDFKNQTVIDKRTGKAITTDPAEADIRYGQRLINNIPEDQNIYVRVKGSKSYVYVSREDFATWGKQKADKHDIVTSAERKVPQASPVNIGGKKLVLNNFDELPDDLKVILKVNNQEEFKNVIANESFRDNKDFIKWTQENDFGKIEIKQGRRKTVYTTKKFVSTPKEDTAYTRAVESVETKTDELYQQKLKRIDTDPIYRNRQELIAKDKEVQGYLATARKQIENANNQDERLQLIADLKAKIDAAKALRDKVATRYNNGVDFLNKQKASKQTRFKGTQKFKSVTGEVYSLHNILEGSQGEISGKMLYATSVQSDLISGIDPSIYRHLNGVDHYDIRLVNPEDANYFRDYAGYLKYFGRNDGAFQRVAAKLHEIRVQRGQFDFDESVIKEINDDLVGWLKNTPEGRKYAVDNRIGRKYSKATQTGEQPGAYQTYEDFADSMNDFVNGELYDDDLLSLFVARDIDGNLIEINEQGVRNALKGKDLQPVKGREAVAAVGQRGVMKSVNKLIANANRWLVEAPQTYLENVPMAQLYYMENFKSLINANELSLGRKLNADELSAVNIEARKYAVEETRKWLYNVQSKLNVTEALALLVPFLTAVTFTTKMMVRGAKEKPEQLLWTLGVGSKILGEFNYADEKGNPIKMSDALVPESNSYLIMNIPESHKEFYSKLPWIGRAFDDAKQFRVSMRSLNVWYGQEWVPNGGPIVTVPVNMMINNFPMAAYNVNYVFEGTTGADLIDYFLPFGPQDDLLNMVLPTWLKQARDWYDAGPMYQDAFAKIMAFEAARYRIDPERYGEPDMDDINTKVRALFAFKLLSSTSLLASTKIETEVDYYRQMHRNLIDQFGKNEADWILLTKYPEFIGVTVSTTENPYSLNSNQQTFDNLNIMPNVVNIFQYGGDGAKDMLGWALNPSGIGRYDDYFFEYLRSASPGPGADKFRRILSPEEIRRKAEAAPGWIMYNKFHGALDAYASERGITWKDDKRATTYRAQLIKELSIQYPEWASEYKSSNRNSYNERADALEQLLNEPEWFGKVKVQQEIPIETLRSFIEMRKHIKNDLFNKGLTLASSKPHKKMYEDFIFQLKRDSIEFSTFYNKFFEDDTLN
jgi:hypothetical protein